MLLAANRSIGSHCSSPKCANKPVLAWGVRPCFWGCGRIVPHLGLGLGLINVESQRSSERASGKLGGYACLILVEVGRAAQTPCA